MGGLPSIHWKTLTAKTKVPGKKKKFWLKTVLSTLPDLPDCQAALHISDLQPLQWEQLLKINFLCVQVRMRVCVSHNARTAGAGKKVILLLFVVTFRAYSSMQRHQGSYWDKTCVPLTLILQLCHSPLAEECSPLLMSQPLPHLHGDRPWGRITAFFIHSHSHEHLLLVHESLTLPGLISSAYLPPFLRLALEGLTLVCTDPMDIVLPLCSVLIRSPQVPSMAHPSIESCQPKRKNKQTKNPSPSSPYFCLITKIFINISPMCPYIFISPNPEPSVDYH